MGRRYPQKLWILLCSIRFASFPSPLAHPPCLGSLQRILNPCSSSFCSLPSSFPLEGGLVLAHLSPPGRREGREVHFPSSHLLLPSVPPLFLPLLFHLYLTFFFLAPWVSDDMNAEPLTRISQYFALRLPNVGLATAVDLGDKDSPFGSIHPRDKQAVGYRLALNALAIHYGVHVQNTG